MLSNATLEFIHRLPRGLRLFSRVSAESELEDDSYASALFLGGDGSARVFYRVLLDSGSEVNVMGQNVVEALGLEIKPCDKSIRVPGLTQKPLGYVIADFFFVGSVEEEPYEEIFYVIKEEGNFDTLVSEDFIWSNGVYKRVRAKAP
jgi:hypothetical protein